MNGYYADNTGWIRNSHITRSACFVLQKGRRQRSVSARPEYNQGLQGFGISYAENYRVTKGSVTDQGRYNRKART